MLLDKRMTHRDREAKVRRSSKSLAATVAGDESIRLRYEAQRSKARAMMRFLDRLMQWLSSKLAPRNVPLETMFSAAVLSDAQEFCGTRSA